MSEMRIWGLVIYLVLQGIMAGVAFYARRYYKTKEQEAAAAVKKEEGVFEVRTTRTLAKDVAFIGIGAALATALTVALGPISIGIAGINTRLSYPVMPTLAVLYDPLVAAISSTISAVLGDVFLGWLAPWTAATVVTGFIGTWVIGTIIRDPRKLIITIPVLLIQSLISSIYVGWVLDLSGVVPFAVMMPSVLLGHLPWSLVGTPLIMNLLYARGFYYRPKIAAAAVNPAAATD